MKLRMTLGMRLLEVNPVSRTHVLCCAAWLRKVNRGNSIKSNANVSSCCICALAVILIRRGDPASPMKLTTLVKRHPRLNSAHTKARRTWHRSPSVDASFRTAPFRYPLTPLPGRPCSLYAAIFDTATKYQITGKIVERTRITGVVISSASCPQRQTSQI